ncbi:MAG: non-canonical purine NTP pyrophosphatase [Candidatus Baltobacteraceae bacterium]
MQVFAATKNAGKLRELRVIFRRYGWTLDAFEGYRDPEEVEDSYAGNAALKARALSAQLRAAGLDAAAIGDDSGFEVSALQDRPGIRSARYGTPGATWAQRRTALLTEFARTGSADRRARFVCALHLVEADGTEQAAIGTIEGRLASAERGEGGFSYDAIFELPAGHQTFAEVSEGEKNAISHRARAAEALVAGYADPRAALGSEATKRE